MTEKMVFWLPGNSKIKQHNRLRIILTPLMDQLRQNGVDATFGAMLSDDFEKGAGCLNIWFVTELNDTPPMPGRHIAWFLAQMKLTPHSVLMAYDAIFTASVDHHRFLTAWIGHLRPVRLLGWPIPPINMPSVAQRIPKLRLEHHVKTSSKDSKRIIDLPANAQALANALGQYQVIDTTLALRERMCGFCGFEEIVAALAGCKLVGEPREGLAKEIAPFFSLRDAPLSDESVAQTDLSQLQIWRQKNDPSVVAASILEFIRQEDGAAISSASLDPPAPFGLKSDVVTKSEVDAFFRDCSALLHLMQDIKPQIAAAGLNNRVVSAPWNAALSHAFNMGAITTSWSDLSLTRYICEEIQAGRYVPTADDCQRLNQIHAVLLRYRPDLQSRPLPMDLLPEIPWMRVTQECNDKRRDYQALSRAVNGHYLYVFSQSTINEKKLSPELPFVQQHLSAFTARAAIFFHAFYVDVAIQIIHMLKGNLAHCPIFVTTDTAEKRIALMEQFTLAGWGQFRVDVIENTGRDIYAKLVHLAKDHANFDYALHLHTKKSPHSNSLKSWGHEMVDLLAGDIERIGQIGQAFSDDPQLGIVYADPPKALHPAMSWTRNLRLSEMLALSLGLKALPHSLDVDFPVGSMFWARTDALRMILQNQIGPQHFVQEEGQEDGTLAHAFERMLGVVCHAQGYHMSRSCKAKPKKTA